MVTGILGTLLQVICTLGFFSVGKYIPLHSVKMWGNQGIAAMIFNLDTGCRLVATFVSQSGQSEEDTSLLPLPGFEPHFLRCPTHCLVFIQAVLLWLHSFLQTLNKLYLALVCRNLAVDNFVGCSYGKVLL